MISLREVQKLAYEQQASEQSIERDYILTCILAELSRHPSLGKAAMLKGGTALKKLYYPEWRYSEDLDFTLTKPWTVEAITIAISEACAACLQSTGLEVNIATVEPRYDGAQLRNVTSYLAYIGPLRRTRKPRELKVDFTADEVIVAKPVKRPLKRMYSDEAQPPRKILCYPLEEIFAEKMRTILQRTEPRDLYDVWRLLQEHHQEINLQLAKSIFEAKCRFKAVQLKNWGDFLTQQKIEKYQVAWERRLAEQVQGLPPLKTVVREMKQLLRAHFG